MRDVPFMGVSLGDIPLWEHPVNCSHDTPGDEGCPLGISFYGNTLYTGNGGCHFKAMFLGIPLYGDIP